MSTRPVPASMSTPLTIPSSVSGLLISGSSTLASAARIDSSLGAVMMPRVEASGGAKTTQAGGGAQDGAMGGSSVSGGPGGAACAGGGGGVAGVASPDCRGCGEGSGGGGGGGGGSAVTSVQPGTGASAPSGPVGSGTPVGSPSQPSGQCSGGFGGSRVGW